MQKVVRCLQIMLDSKPPQNQPKAAQDAPSKLRASSLDSKRCIGAASIDATRPATARARSAGGGEAGDSTEAEVLPVPGGVDEVERPRGERAGPQGDMSSLQWLPMPPSQRPSTRPTLAPPLTTNARKSSPIVAWSCLNQSNKREGKPSPASSEPEDIGQPS